MTLSRTPNRIPLHKLGPRCGPTDWLMLPAPAKINLFLEIQGRREDGFHELDTIMAPLRLADRLWFRPLLETTQIKLTVVGPRKSSAPAGDQNLVVRAVERVRNQTGVSLGAEIVLEKNIPSEAGMGGGSSDAAAALLLARSGWRLDLPNSELTQLAAGIGSDVPFFLAGGPALCRGRGEQVRPINAPAGMPLVIVKPLNGLSTPAVYQRHAELARSAPHRSSATLIEALARGDWQTAIRQQFNRLEEPAFQLAQGLNQLATQLNSIGGLVWRMTGSGSAMFALTPNFRRARQLAAQLRQQNLGSVMATRLA